MTRTATKTQRKAWQLAHVLYAVSREKLGGAYTFGDCLKKAYAVLQQEV